MQVRSTAVLVLALVVALLSFPLALSAQADELADVEIVFGMEGMPDDPQEPWRDFVDGWKAFGSWRFMLQEMVGIVLAALLAAGIAYHPRISRRGNQAVEGPKAIVLYAVVGSLIAKIVHFNPPMAFVIFGIGGLMRFRSEMGSPKDTVITILVVVVGLACGLNLFAGAIMAAAIGWSLVWVLEARRTLQLEVRKLDSHEVASARASFERALELRGARVREVRLRPKKGRLWFDVRVPRNLDPDELEESLEVSPELRQKATWEWQP